MTTLAAGTSRPVFIRAAEIFGPSGILPISRSTFYAWLAEGRLPAGKKLSHGVTVWNLDDIVAFAEGGAR